MIRRQPTRIKDTRTGGGSFWASKLGFPISVGLPVLFLALWGATIWTNWHLGKASFAWSH